MDTEGIAKLAALFRDRFGAAPTAAGSAPGRVEVLGNHTDYNDGHILAAAINRRVHVVGRPVPGSIARLWSAGFNEEWSFPADGPVRTDKPLWANYPMGVAAELAKAGRPAGGFEAVIGGDVPVGAGVSSSAALQVATAAFLRQAFGFALEGMELALLAKRSENDFVGVQCGLLDPYTSVMGRRGQLVCLDCRHPEPGATLPLGDSAALVLADTRARHTLADGAYNRLRESCFAAARDLAGRLPGRRVTHLRDVSWEDFLAQGSALPEAERRRARHIISENARVLRGQAALRAGDLAQMGVLMSASHASSRDDFGNSCRELDVMVESALPLPGCHGARLSGGGFGGCVVCLVDSARTGDFARTLTEKYKGRTGLEAAVHVCHADRGAESAAL